MTVAMTMTSEEWTRRFAARIQEQAGWSEEAAMQCAQAAAESHDYMERNSGREPQWLDPEDAADDEMSYWEDDGDE